ncbi:MAG: hypothetical protein RLZZ241_2631 [Bacteroidota bacterium]
MLFKNAQMLWALWMLLIPVLIHLMQFRRFQKTAFTNVRILQEVLQKSNKGNRIKSWVLLCCRLGFLTTLIFAFAQPFTVPSSNVRSNKIVIYLDNSFSMQAPEKGASTLQNAVQSLFREFPETFEFSLLTNNETYPHQNLTEYQESLLNLDFTSESLDFKTLKLRFENLMASEKSADHELWIISDFQELNVDSLIEIPEGQVKSVVIRPESRMNISIDSAAMVRHEGDLQEFEVFVTLDDTTKNAALSFMHRDTLLAKGIPEITGAHSGRLTFSIPAKASLLGYFRVEDQGLSYDNTLYLNLTQQPKTKVYVVGPGPDDYFRRIYTPNEFEYNQTNLMYLDYSLLNSQNLLVLNELPHIPETLIEVLRNFAENGGTLLVVPAGKIDLDSYNELLQSISEITLKPTSALPELVTNIAFEHPLYSNVFAEKAQNFDYPEIQQHYPIKSLNTGILNFQNGSPYLVESNDIYVFASGLNRDISNITESPLIVPTLYNLGRISKSGPRLYFNVGEKAALDVTISTFADQIISLKSQDYNCIPLQQSTGTGVKLQFEQEPSVHGSYDIIHNEMSYGHVSFNYIRNQSTPEYPSLTFPKGIKTFNSLEELAAAHRNALEIHQLWKWFVIFALLFVLAETMLQKFWK